MIVHLNGMPGVGKLTVAKMLASELSARLIDNHRLIDTVTICCEHGSPSYLEMLTKLTDMVFEGLQKLPPGEIFIFTNALACEMAEDRERLHVVESLAQKRNVPFVPVLLTCALEENKTRLTDPFRTTKGKLTNPDILSSLYEKYTMYHPQSCPYATTIDATSLKPEQVAGKIMEHIKGIQ